jgi:hypothetical protein
VTGIVNYYSGVKEVRKYNTHEKHTIDDIDKLIRRLKERGIYVIARVSVFRDHLLYKKNPRMAIRSKTTGGMWRPETGELWCDPTNRSVQDYNIAIAAELADKGVDEIQFDYIRFPTMGNLRDADLAYHFGRAANDEIIAHFLRRAQGELLKRNSLLSIDIFGVVAWGKKVDIMSTGQRIELLSNYCDVISPMLYPSHFNDDFDGFSNPGDHPYHFISFGCKRMRDLSKNISIRPWLQAFRWRVSNYDESYILEQIRASDDSGTSGYLFWNASNNYEVVYRAMSKMGRLKKNSQRRIAVNDERR